MDIALAIYKGGEEINANDTSLNYNSYKEWGLICPFCHQEVHWRSGEKVSPYFAHFKSNELTKDCDFRKYSSNGYPSWRNLVIDKKQRRSLFEQHFLQIINNTHLDFLDLINKAIYRAKFTANDKKIIIEEFIDSCVKCFNKNILNIRKRIRFHTDYEDYDVLNKSITLEVIDYLSQKDHCELLKKIFLYVYQKELLLSGKEITLSEESISLQFLNILITTNWTHGLYIFSDTACYVSLNEKLFNFISKKENNYLTRSSIRPGYLFVKIVSSIGSLLVTFPDKTGNIYLVSKTDEWLKKIERGNHTLILTKYNIKPVFKLTIIDKRACFYPNEEFNIPDEDIKNLLKKVTTIFDGESLILLSYFLGADHILAMLVNNLIESKTKFPSDINKIEEEAKSMLKKYQNIFTDC
jgi:hypothetical protein